MGKYSLFLIVNKNSRELLISTYNLKRELVFAKSPDLFELIARSYQGKDFEENKVVIFHSLFQAQKQIDYYVNNNYSNSELLETFEIVFENNFK